MKCVQKISGLMKCVQKFDTVDKDKNWVLVAKTNQGIQKLS